MKQIDFRSDTFTRPDDDMRAAVLCADVGDDVYGEDPTVNTLEDYTAGLPGKEAAVFCTSGTQSNLMTLLSHCQRGDEYIAAQNAHTYRYEGGGAAVLGGVQPQPLNADINGVIPVDQLAAAIKPEDIHFTRTKLICLENTFSGACLPLDYANEVRTLTDECDLKLHLDSARLFNAAVRMNEPAEVLAAAFDSVSICLSKGLGARVTHVKGEWVPLDQSVASWR